MKLGFYPKLALTGVSKNRRIYLPYILTCIGMVMMFYIVSFLAASKSVTAMPGGNSIQMILSLGCGVIGFFSLLFLFYTNSFLMRKRKREFGLYNILGMGKRNIARILLWEALFIAVVSLVGGIFCGILFSKAAELLMARILGGRTGFGFTVGIASLMETAVLFAGIFLLILLHALRQIHLAKPVELLHSDAVGEKPPKSNWLLAILGAVILGCAYHIALTVKQPLTALVWFFAAVILVILATYLLFIAGSVTICRLLQKNKRYYYRANHFVSVSSMVYRMKRNGAGLASICILSTMVLVMVSSTVCLYAGTESSLRSRYPRNVVVDTESLDARCDAAVDDAVGEILAKNSVRPEDTLRYRYMSLTGYVKGSRVIFNQSSLNPSETTQIRQCFIVPLEDYNRLMGTHEQLADNEAILYCTRKKYTGSTVDMQGLPTMRIKKQVSKFIHNGTEAMNISPSMFVIVPDFDRTRTLVKRQYQSSGEDFPGVHAYYGFDLRSDSKTQTAVAGDISSAVKALQAADGNFPKVTVESAAQNRADFYGLFGGLFFLGVLLGLVFILGAVLIMYYKQITEGYEDQSRFAIMRKVGMTRHEIRRSVDSQVLTVFFLPLAVSGIHTAFAFPMISKLLALFNLTNIRMLATISGGCFLMFALFYTLVYFVTSRTYYRIVSSSENA